MAFNVNKTFGPPECWCAPGGGAFYPCKKNKLCKETNEKYNKMKQKYLKSKTYKKDKETRKKRSLERAKRRSGCFQRCFGLRSIVREFIERLFFVICFAFLGDPDL